MDSTATGWRRRDLVAVGQPFQGCLARLKPCPTGINTLARNPSAVPSGEKTPRRTRAEGGFFHVADPVFGAVRFVPGFRDLTR